MKYTGNICDGCGLPFSDEDDVVVCPECGTPQHRECYEKENKCVCSHLHTEDYTWKGIVNKEAPIPEIKKELISCPNCGYGNPKGTEVCRNCGMKFTIFGKNVVDAMHEQENHNYNQNRDIPDYNAPFTLGEGEGFDAPVEAEEKPAAAQVEELITSVLEGDTQQPAEGDGRINLGGPFPVTDEIDGVMTNTIGNFIGTNAMGYISKFKKIQRGKKLSFNFAAFFFGAYWLFYRKLYKAGIVLMTVLFSLSIIMTPYLMDVLEAYEKILPVMEGAAMSEAQLTALYNEMLAASAPLAIYFFITLALQFIVGFSANHIYKKYVIDHSRKAERLPSKRLAMAYVVKNGGSSILIAIAAYFAQQLLSVVVSGLL